MEDNIKYCAHCGQEIEDSYYKCLDNFLLIKYFDSYEGEDNIFCSKNCFCEALFLEEFDLKEEKDLGDVDE